ncbi:hypothetical protein CCACVL1_26508 [Corchorus capsularis]|uniref:Uncharacterized protein n=1 Tax=Corchorus capsularis TaxID=210143 RepID=A0A1R3GEJ9_COCAP|nr:hypothetical protein CCACVL1_26508 [Corchorus capsularis]
MAAGHDLKMINSSATTNNIVSIIDLV